MSSRVPRRDVLKQSIALAGLSAFAPRPTAAAPVQPAATGGDEFFPGFTTTKVKTSGAEIHVVHAGSGPPLLLLHGAPQTHISWRLVAPELAKTHTVVVARPARLRRQQQAARRRESRQLLQAGDGARSGRGDEALRLRQFPVVGHDRGGRVGHRLALDHPDKVTRLAVLDIVPTYYLYTHVTIEFVQAYFHWFNYVRPAPGPEEQLKAQYEQQAAKRRPRCSASTCRVYNDTAALHGMCEDYRAGASIDLQHDKADLDKKIQCPLLALWAREGADGPDLRRARRSGASGPRR